MQSTLERLAARDASEEGSASGPLTAILPRQPGSREARYAHLLGGQTDRATAPDVAGSTDLPSAPATTERHAQMEQQLAEFGAALRALQTRVERLESERSAPSAGATASLASNDTLRL